MISNLSYNFKCYLRSYDLTLKELSSQTGINLATLSGLSKGRNMCSVEDMLKISSFFNVSPEMIARDYNRETLKLAIVQYCQRLSKAQKDKMIKLLRFVFEAAENA